MQFNRLPTKIENVRLSPGAQLMYLYMYKSRDYETNETFKSIDVLSTEAKVSRPTVSAYIKELIAAGFVQDTGKKRGRSKVYKLLFTDSKFFEKFDNAFLANHNLKYSAKATYVATQSFLISKDEGYASTTYSIQRLSQEMGVPHQTLLDNFKILEKEGILTESRRIDPISGTVQTVKSFDLHKLGQFVLCQTIKTAADVKDLQDSREDMLERIERLEKSDKEKDNEIKRLNKIIKEQNKVMKRQDKNNKKQEEQPSDIIM
jgi:DNA-binding transcriptional MocR family regulator